VCVLPRFLHYLTKYKNTGENDNGFLCNMLHEFVKTMFTYINETYEFIDKDLSEEIKISIMKEFILLVGANFAYCKKGNTKSVNKQFDRINEVLKSGV